ncbi:hypothetical protein OF83DRAFT_1174111 [Amylostereum chailletii]|nr:hypothetical protein OF83DRAFT_1174111 [Amylostereum chailletii]
MARPTKSATLSVEAYTSRPNRVSLASTMSENSLFPDDLLDQLGDFPRVPDALDLAAFMGRMPSSIMEDEEPWEGFASLVAREMAGSPDGGFRDQLALGEIGIGSGGSFRAGKTSIANDTSSSHGHGEDHNRDATCLSQVVRMDGARRPMSVPESPGMSYSSTSASTSPPTTPQGGNYPSTADISSPSDELKNGLHYPSPPSSTFESQQPPSRTAPSIHRKLNSISQLDSLSPTWSEFSQDILVPAPRYQGTTALASSSDSQITPQPLAIITDVDGTDGHPTDDSDTSFYPIFLSPATLSPTGTHSSFTGQSSLSFMSKEDLSDYRSFLDQRAEDVFPAARALAPTPHPISTLASTSTLSLTRHGRPGPRDDGMSDFSWEAMSTAPSVRDEPAGEGSVAGTSRPTTSGSGGVADIWSRKKSPLGPTPPSTPEDLTQALDIVRVERGRLERDSPVPSASDRDDKAGGEEAQNGHWQEPVNPSPAMPSRVLPPPLLVPPPSPINSKPTTSERPATISMPKPPPVAPPRPSPPSPTITIQSMMEDEYLPDFLDFGSDTETMSPMSMRPMGILSALSTVPEDFVASPSEMRSPASSYAPSASTGAEVHTEDEDDNGHGWADPVIPRLLPRKAASMGDLAAGGAQRRAAPLGATHSETQVPTAHSMRMRTERQVSQPSTMARGSPSETSSIRPPISPGTGSWRGPSTQAYMQRGYERPPLQPAFGNRESIGDASFDFRRQSRHAYGVRDIAYALLESEGYEQTSPIPSDPPSHLRRQSPLSPGGRARAYSHSVVSRASTSSEASTSYASHPYRDHPEPPASPSSSTSIPPRPAAGYTPGVPSPLADARAQPRPPALPPIVTKRPSASELAPSPARERILRQHGMYSPLDVLPSVHSASPGSNPSPSLPYAQPPQARDPRSYFSTPSSRSASLRTGGTQMASPVQGSIVDIADALAQAMDRRGSPSAGDRRTENLRHKVSIPGLLKPMPDMTIDYSSSSKEAFPSLDPPTSSLDRDRSPSPYASLAGRRTQSNAPRPTRAATVDSGSFGFLGSRNKNKQSKSKKEDFMPVVMPSPPMGRIPPPQVTGKAAKLLGTDDGLERELMSFIPSTEEKMRSQRKGLFGMMRWGRDEGR